ncbi:predicted protein [Nematostella vectensis]|uniref:Uncharacterized protein n=1 Tax=Nematostella vectensis TaxID=45351 RepID=A7SIQ1_NEMVE|nr:predicted protein [Nematostella vectensis]|eukprot:XP_001628490.1 predicted protein [Nematostella vectensis]
MEVERPQSSAQRIYRFHPPTEKKTGQEIANVILEKLQSLGLDPKNIRGQGYDEAANMSSDNVGSPAQNQEAPKAVYVHYSGHCLNLFIAHSCHQQSITSAIDKLKQCSLFFLEVQNEKVFLTFEKAVDDADRRKALVYMCRTRWAARHNAYTHFYQSFTFIITSLENIIYGANSELMGGEHQDASWDRRSKDNAASLLASLTSFYFIVSFLVLYEFLSHLAGITVKLQGRAVDIFKGLSVHASRLHCFVPSILCEKFPDEEAEAILDTYKDDLPSLELLHQELVRFKIRLL